MLYSTLLKKSILLKLFHIMNNIKFPDTYDNYNNNNNYYKYSHLFISVFIALEPQRGQRTVSSLLFLRMFLISISCLELF